MHKSQRTQFHEPGCMISPLMKSFNFAPTLLGAALFQFDDNIGREIRCMYPPGIFTDHMFTSSEIILIPRKKELCNRLLIVDVDDYRVMFQPIHLCDDKYPRYNFFFAVAFLFPIKDDDPESDIRLYEAVLQKLADYFVNFELDFDVLSDRSKGDAQVLHIIQSVYEGLSQRGECFFAADERTLIALRLLPPCITERPEQYNLYVVPTIIRSSLPAIDDPMYNKLDLVCRKLRTAMNGVNTFKHVLDSVPVDNNIVSRTVHNLVYSFTVQFMPQFLYCYSYVVTPAFQAFLSAEKTQEECVQFIKRRKCFLDPDLTDVLYLYSTLRHGFKMEDWHRRYNPRRYNIDERRMILFGTYYGFVRRQEVYPHIRATSLSPIYRLCNGENTIDDIAFYFKISPRKLFKIFELSEKVYLVYK